MKNLHIRIAIAGKEYFELKKTLVLEQDLLHVFCPTFCDIVQFFRRFKTQREP